MHLYISYSHLGLDFFIGTCSQRENPLRRVEARSGRLPRSARFAIRETVLPPGLLLSRESPETGWMMNWAAAFSGSTGSRKSRARTRKLPEGRRETCPGSPLLSTRCALRVSTPRPLLASFARAHDKFFVVGPGVARGAGHDSFGIQSWPKKTTSQRTSPLNLPLGRHSPLRRRLDSPLWTYPMAR
jgi:hypothetical protein